MTGPYPADTLARLRSGELATSLTCYLPARSTSTPVPVSRVALTFDESWAPHVVAEVTMPRLDDALLGQTDPRLGHRVELWAGYAGADDGAPSYRVKVADLRIKSRRASRRSGTVQLVAYSRELDVQETYDPGLSPGWVAGEPVANVIVELLTGLGHSVVDDTGATPYVLDEDVQLVPGDDLWGFIRGLADSADMWVRDEGTGTFRITERGALSATPAAVLDETVVTDVTDELDVTEWANGVLVTQDGRSELAELQDPHPLAPPTALRRVKLVDRTTAAGVPLSGIAERLLWRTLTRGVGTELDLVPLWWLRPGQTVTNDVRPAPGPELVERVRFDVDEGGHRMTVRTRQPRLDPSGLSVLVRGSGTATIEQRLATVESDVQAVQTRQAAEQQGSVVIASPINAGGVWVRNVTFDVPYEVPPFVSVVLRGASGGTAGLNERRSQPTTTGFTIYVYNVGATTASWTGSMYVDWKAEPS